MTCRIGYESHAAVVWSAPVIELLTGILPMPCLAVRRDSFSRLKAKTYPCRLSSSWAKTFIHSGLRQQEASTVSASGKAAKACDEKNPMLRKLAVATRWNSLLWEVSFDCAGVSAGLEEQESK